MCVLSGTVVTTLVLAGCGSGSGSNSSGGNSGTGNTGSGNTAAAPASKQNITLDIINEPPNLNPANSNDSTSGFILGSTFEGLTYIGKDGKPQPGIAKSWDISQDGLTYTFHLRDAKWSNGDAITAGDFVWEWKHVLDPNTGSQFASYLNVVKGAEAYNSGKGSADDVAVKALDDHTLQVTLSTPVPYFLSMLPFWTFYPVDSKVAQANPKWATDAATYVGDGPFVLKTWDHQQKVVLQKNPNYWNKDAIQLNQITGVMVSDANTMYQMYKSGQLDMDLAPPVDLVPQLIQNKQAMVQPMTGTFFLDLNTKNPPFNNENIRKAFSMAINREQLTKDVLQGGQFPALAFDPPGLPGTDGGDFRKQGGNLISEDPTQAKQLLQKGMQELGITQLPPLTFKYNTLESNKKVAEALQQMWQQNLGVNVTLQNEDWKVYLDDLKKGNFQFGRLGWIDTWLDPSNILDLAKSNFGANYSGWSNPQYDQLVNDAEQNMDSQKRMDEMHKAEQTLMNSMPIIPVYFYDNVFLFNSKLAGIVVQPNNSMPDMRYLYVKNQ